jgi:hypothetical protein
MGLWFPKEVTGTRSESQQIGDGMDKCRAKTNKSTGMRDRWRKRTRNFPCLVMGAEERKKGTVPWREVEAVLRISRRSQIDVSPQIDTRTRRERNEGRPSLVAEA